MKRYTAVIGLMGLGATIASPGKGRKGRDGRVTEPLRAEHRQLLPHVQALRGAGDSIAAATPAEQVEKVRESYLFLTEHLIPHAVAEDKVLYVEVDRLLGTKAGTRATDTMRRDHQEVGTLTEQLGTLAQQLESGTLAAEQQRDLRRVLYSLHGIVTLHFAKEEEVYLPLLDRILTAEQAQQMFEQMERITNDMGGAGHPH